jgi:3-oxoacyl-[acyl-carrier-protein] synthase-3
VQDIDLILAASVSGETSSPSMACMIQNKLGATCPALEVSAACSAFLFLLETAAAYFALRSQYKRILVVGCERMSGIVDWTDRGTCVIFGDGAGAAVLERGEGYLDAVYNVKGGDDVIKIPYGVGCSPFFKAEQDSPYIHMQGQETFQYAVTSLCDDVTTLLERNGLTMDDIAYVVPHQANKRIVDFARKRLRMPEEKMFCNIEKYGNTSSASVPIALDELAKSGKLNRGNKIILCAFGGGLADAACLIEW